MTDILQLGLPFLAGCGLGVLYFGGLWLTVRGLTAGKSSGFLLAGSFLLRTALLLWAFHAVMGGRWERLLACLLGFLVARRWLVSRYGQPAGTGVLRK